MKYQSSFILNVLPKVPALSMKCTASYQDTSDKITFAFWMVLNTLLSAP